MPLILAGGVAAVRGWHPGGETAATSPAAAFATSSGRAPEPEDTGRGPAGGAAPSAAEAASERAEPRPVTPTPTPARKDDARPGATPKPKKGKAEPESADVVEGRSEHPSGGRWRTGEPGASEGESAEPGGTEPGTLRPGEGLAGDGAAVLLQPDVTGGGDDAPGRTGLSGEDSGGGKDGGDGDGKVLDYFLKRWGKKDAAMKKVTDIRVLGGYLRVYTKMPDTAVNHKHAVKLCERGREYLAKERGVRHPVVFVHARAGLNGNPVLANDLGSRDPDCRLTTPRPGRGGGKRS